MKVRAIDENHDWVFGTGLQSYVENDREIAQMIKTRVLSFLGDCFFAINEGIDWFNLLEKGAENEAMLKRSIGLTILKTNGVVALNEVDLTKNGRTVIINYNVKTIYSMSYQNSIEVLND